MKRQKKQTTLLECVFFLERDRRPRFLFSRLLSFLNAFVLSFRRIYFTPLNWLIYMPFRLLVWLKGERIHLSHQFTKVNINYRHVYVRTSVDSLWTTRLFLWNNNSNNKFFLWMNSIENNRFRTRNPRDDDDDFIILSKE